MSRKAKWITPLVPFLVGAVLNISGYQNPTLAAFLWIITGCLVLWIYVPPAVEWIVDRAARYRKRIVIVAEIMIGVLWLVPIGVWLLPKNEPEPQLAVKSVDKGLLGLVHQTQGAKVSKFAQIRVVNTGKKRVGNVKVIVTRVGNLDVHLQLSLKSLDTLFASPNPGPILVSVDLGPGDDQDFDILVECNGTWGCPKGELAIPQIDNGRRFYSTISPTPNDLTVRVSGDIGSAVTKTFIITRGSQGELVLEAKPEK